MKEISKDIRISVTEDYEKLVPFFIENQLEFSEDDPVPTDLVKCWETTDAEGRLVGGFVLAKREGEFIVDGIATDPALRGKKLGEALLETGLEEAKRQGARRIYLVARAPGFFGKYGFVSVERNHAPNFFECFTCPQYRVSCFPEVMVLEL